MACPKLLGRRPIANPEISALRLSGVPDLLALAGIEASAEVRAALIRLADRYAAMADHPIPAIAA
jgi:hypothetical protein